MRNLGRAVRTSALTAHICIDTRLSAAVVSLPASISHHGSPGAADAWSGKTLKDLKADLMGTAKFIDGCKLPYIAPSLGGVESLIEQPTIVSYWDQTPEVRAKLGIKDNLVRFACGVEDYADIEADVLQALDQI